MEFTSLQEIKKAIKQVVNSAEHGIGSKFIFKNEQYAISKYNHKNDQAGIYLWADDGVTSLASIEYLTTDKSSKQNTIDTLIAKIAAYADGYISCSDCGRQIKRSEVAGSYFAGRYCSHCWESKWKAIEARETYD